MDNWTTADPSTECEVEALPSPDDVTVVFHADPAPVVVHRRPRVLTALWIVALLAGAAALALVGRDALDTSPPADRVLEVGEYRSLTDDGAPVDMRCARRIPSRLGSPCLREPDFLDAVLAGRPSVLLVGNVTSATRPDGAIRCVLIAAGDGGAVSTAVGIPCPDNDFVAAG